MVFSEYWYSTDLFFVQKKTLTHRLLIQWANLKRQSSWVGNFFHGRFEIWWDMIRCTSMIWGINMIWGISYTWHDMVFNNLCETADELVRCTSFICALPEILFFGCHVLTSGPIYSASHSDSDHTTQTFPSPDMSRHQEGWHQEGWHQQLESKKINRQKNLFHEVINPLVGIIYIQRC